MAAAQVARKTLSPAFPFSLKVAKGQVSLLVAEYDSTHFEQAHHLFKQAAEAGDGYSMEEVEQETLKKKLVDARTLTFMEEKTQDVVCVLPITDSPAVRSTNGMLCTMFTVVDPRFRGQGLVRDAYKVGFPVSIDKGYFGVTARVALTARNIIPCLAVGGQITGTIPMCSNLEKVGYVDDVLAYMSHNLDRRMPDYNAELCRQRDAPLPQLSADEEVLKGLCAWNELPTTEVKSPLGMINIRSVRNTDEILEAEKLLRQSAEKGHGFGVDEFDNNGHFNRKFFRSTDIVVAEGPEGDIMGCALVGPSNLSRMVTPVIAHHYLAVKDNYVNNGIATNLMKYCAKYTKSQGHKLLISDTYLTDFKIINMLRNNKWLFRGSMPYCGYLRGIGPTDSLVVYLPL